MDNSQDKQPFLSHLEELRKRLIACVVAVGVGFAGGYVFKERLFNILVAPIRPAMPNDGHLIFTGPTEMFLTQIKVALIGGILLVIPFIFYEIWMFVAPGLYQKEKQAITPLIVLSTILFALGAIFAYLVVLPIAFQFLLGFGSQGADASVTVEPLISVKEGFGFSIKMLFAFGIAFQLPIVIFFLSRMVVVTPDTLSKKRGYAILLVFMAGAILTPPDVISQCLLAIPLMALYEVGIIISKFPKKPKTDSEEEAETQEEGDKAQA